MLYRDSVEPSNKVTGQLTGPAGDEVWASGNVEVEGSKVCLSILSYCSRLRDDALTCECVPFVVVSVCH